MQNFLSLGYMLRVLLAVSANFPDNPRRMADSDLFKVAGLWYVGYNLGRDLLRVTFYSSLLQQLQNQID